MPPVDIYFVYITIVLALCFDFSNGFHDASNAIATIISTGGLKPHWAVIWSAFFNFIAFLFFGLHVANTMGTGIVAPHIIDTSFIFSALTGAIMWNIITWYYGLPSSSSHALIGGLIGTALIKSGTHFLIISGILKVILFIVISPFLGMVLGLFIMFINARLFFYMSPNKIDRAFRRYQLLTCALLSLGHGGNDAQKTMGIIAVLLFSANLIGKTFHIPFWVVVTCNFTMALGTLFGGYRIVKTMGMKITKLRPIGGASADTAGALTLFLATFCGIPVSTTHTITGSIIGVGALQRLSAVRWGVARRIVWAWILTLPAAGLIAAVMWLVLHLANKF
jgi:PiT family inorganic phosphate transporter